MYWEAVYVGTENIGLRAESVSLNPRSVISLGKLLNLTEPEFCYTENEANNIYPAYFK